MGEDARILLVLVAAFVGLYLLTRLPLPARTAPRALPPPPPLPVGVGEPCDVDALLRGALEGLDRVRRAGPERPLVVRVPADFPAALRAALPALRAASPGGETFVRVTEYGQRVRLSVVQAPHEAGTPALDPAAAALFDRLDALEDAAVGGAPRTWRSRPPRLGYELPLHPSTPPDPRGLSRFDAGVRELPWPERYALRLERAEWSDLRYDAFRHGSWAERLARYAARHGLRSALCASVGLGADPWLLAAAGLRVVAFDRALPAVRAVAHPQRLPRVYSAAAKEARDVDAACSWDRGIDPHAFGGLPDLGRPEVLAELAPRLVGLQADWARLPLASGSVDVVLGCNALPRDTRSARAAVLAEWTRVLRPGGVVLLRMHNGYEVIDEARALLAGRGLREVDLRQADAPPPGPVGAFQAFGSSG